MSKEVLVADSSGEILPTSWLAKERGDRVFMIKRGATYDDVVRKIASENGWEMELTDYGHFWRVVLPSLRQDPCRR